MTIQPTDLVLKYGPWSLSKADCAAQCPKKFDLQYIHKGPKTRNNSDALVGQAVHKVLELVMQATPAVKAYEAASIMYQLTSVEQARVDDLRPFVDNFVVKFEDWCKRHNVHQTITERKFAVDIEGNPTEFFGGKTFFRGVVDLMAFMSDMPHVAILDHKTGKPRGISHYKNQFDSYRLLIKAKYPRLTGAITGINFLQIDQVIFQKFSNLPEIPALMDTIMIYLNESTKNLDNLERTIPGPLCGWCDHHLMCSGVVPDTGTGNG